MLPPGNKHKIHYIIIIIINDFFSSSFGNFIQKSGSNPSEQTEMMQQELRNRTDRLSDILCCSDSPQLQVTWVLRHCLAQLMHAHTTHTHSWHLVKAVSFIHQYNMMRNWQMWCRLALTMTLRLAQVWHQSRSWQSTDVISHQAIPQWDEPAALSEPRWVITHHLGSFSLSLGLDDLLSLILFGFLHKELGSLGLLLGYTHTDTHTHLITNKVLGDSSYLILEITHTGINKHCMGIPSI